MPVGGECVCIAAVSLPLAIALCLLGGFVLGSIPFGYWAGRLRGIDIRQHGSGNIGATNVIRVLGKGIGIPVFILDILKGLLPTLIPCWLLHELEPGSGWVSATAVASGLAAVLGHMFTPWLRFKGGKGVATAAGVLAGTAPAAMLAGLVVWLALFFTTRFVSLASMAAAVTVPAAMSVLMARQHRWDPVLLAFGILVAVLVIVRHRSNIRRLLAGTENRAGRRRLPNEPEAKPR